MRRTGGGCKILRRVDARKAWERIGHLYPQVNLPGEYGWWKSKCYRLDLARTVPSPDPAFADVHVPLVSSFLLSSKAGKEVWIEPIVDRVSKTITYEICTGGSKEDWAKAKEGTKQGAWRPISGV